MKVLLNLSLSKQVNFAMLNQDIESLFLQNVVGIILLLCVATAESKILSKYHVP